MLSSADYIVSRFDAFTFSTRPLRLAMVRLTFGVITPPNFMNGGPASSTTALVSTGMTNTATARVPTVNLTWLLAMHVGVHSTRRVVMKMDIEGAEFSTLPDAVEIVCRTVDLILIERHDWFFNPSCHKWGTCKKKHALQHQQHLLVTFEAALKRMERLRSESTIQMCYSRLEFGHGMNRRRAPACAACRVCAVCRQPPVPPRPCGSSVRWRRAGGPEASVSEFYLNERPYTAMKGPPCVRCRNGALFQECRTVYTTDKTQTTNKWKRCRVSSDHRRRRAAGARTKTDKWNTWEFGGERGSA